MKFRYKQNCLAHQVFQGVFLCLLLLSTNLPAQRASVFIPKNSRILFVLDASGSMRGSLDNNRAGSNPTSKFELARQLLIHTIDSISAVNPRVEFAVRVFGHQSPRSAYNCKDTRLEIPFGTNNGQAVAKRLKEIRPQGHTPIEYTLLQAIGDFPADSLSNNSIILITDGNETCHGNICNLALQMKEKGIALKPFIVGLGLSDSVKRKFECAGAFYDVQREELFTGIMRVVVSRALNATTAQINLLDAYGLPSGTNTEITLYDHFTGKVRYNFIHTLNAAGNPDTLVLDPSIIYDMEIHSIPAVQISEIELVQGMHNTIAADVPQGTLELKWETASSVNAVAPCLVRKRGENNILAVQDMNRSQKYLAGKYDLEILVLPRIIMKEVSVDQSKVTAIKIARPGSLSVTPSAAGVASVMMKEGDGLIKVWDFQLISSSKTIALQPGNYLVIYRPEKGKQSSKTKEYPVKIVTGKTTSVRL